MPGSAFGVAWRATWIGTLALLVSACGTATATLRPSADTAWSIGLIDHRQDTNQAIDIAFDGSRFVMLQTLGTGFQLWERPAATPWRVITDPPEPADMAGMQASAVAGNGDTLVVVGTELPGTFIQGTILSWTRQGGWSRIHSPSFRSRNDLYFDDVVWTGTTFVAVGTAPSGGDIPQSSAVVETSSNGIQWQRVDDPALSLGASVSITGAVVRDGVIFVMGTGTDPHDATLLVSRDAGRSWVRVRSDWLKGSIVASVAATTDGLLFAGCRRVNQGTTAATLWKTSLDATTVSATVDVGGQTRHSCLQTLDAVADGFVATGDVDGGGGSWSSTDGSTWTRVELPVESPSDVAVNATAHSQTLEVAVGSRRDPGSILGVGPLAAMAWERSP